MNTPYNIFLRQRDFVTPKQLDFPILIIGAGGIGSWATLALAKMGCKNITVLDFDRVEKHNIPSQLYVPQHSSYLKSLSLQTLIEQLAGVTITPITKAFQEYASNGEYKSYKVIICAVDSLMQRREIWQALKKTKYFKNLSLYIDARMGGEVMRIIIVNLDKKDLVKKYEDNLFTNTSAAKEKCTARAIVYNTFICGGLIANIIKKYAKKEQIRRSFVFDIPSLTII